MNNLILMKAKQFSADANSIQLSTSSVKSTITSSLSSSQSVAIVSDKKSSNGASLSGKRWEGIDATDQQHTAINQTVSEHWKAIRVESLSHPGLLIVFAISSAGLLLTVVAVYVYRCNSTRVRRGGSCEHISEGARDILNDNFNEEIRAFTVETRGQRCAVARDGNDNLLTATAGVNQCDLLPMDILNSTLNQSQPDRGHISMHLW